MKKTNKGFSLVELIIVIAIMAILAGAIAPALIRYIDKSRKSSDVSSAKTIKTSIETAMAKEKCYEGFTNGSGTAITFIDDTSASVSVATVLHINQGVTTDGNGSSAVSLEDGGWFSGTGTDDPTADDLKKAEQEIATNIGEKTPRVKYKKDADTGKAATNTPEFYACVTKGGSVTVYVQTDGKKFQLAPNVSEFYQ